MSIKNRVEDSLYLWQNGRYEGALLSALVAVSATSRLRYPGRAKRDNEVFQKFFNESMRGNTNVEFRDKKVPLGKLFYIWLRNMLVHEGAMPSDIKFIQDGDSEELVVWVPKPPDNILKLSDNWFDKLLNIVISAPENRESLGGFEYLKMQKIENNNKILF